MKKNKIFIIAIFLIPSLILGCGPKDSPEKAKELALKSERFYHGSITEYNKLISRGRNLDRVHYDLGKLYYQRGEFSQAIDEFKKTALPEAKKYLAISHYRLGDFTDALEILSQIKLEDSEYFYYLGLTCEKLNLFDQAISAYLKITQTGLKLKARERLAIIEKEVKSARIKDISSEISNILDNAPTSKEYPQAGALVLYCDERVEITPSDTQASTFHYLVKILNERGKENFSEAHIDYDTTFERVELVYARTIKPDGSVTEVGSRHIRDVSKYLNFPLYSNARVFIISFPEISENAAIEYKVKIYRSQLMNRKDFILNYPVLNSDPVISANFAITLPKDKIIYTCSINDKYNDFGALLKPRIEEKDEVKIYKWEFKNLPQIIPESNMPAPVDINPTILISTFSKWDEVYNWWWGLAQDKIRADQAIKDKVKELLMGLDNDEAKVRAIYNFCARKIRYVAVEYGQAGYEPHKAEDIFRNKYGDCKDQAILLVTMLKEAGFRAWPVLIGTKDYYNLKEDFPAAFFNHCIAALVLKDRVIFLDPTAETCSLDDLPSGDQGRKVLVSKEEAYDIIDTPLYPAQHNLNRQLVRLKIKPDETLSAAKSVYSQGIYDQGQRYWLLYTQPELIAEILKKKIQEVSIGATLTSYNVDNLNDLNKPVVLNYDFQGPEYFTSAGMLRIMPQLISLDTSLTAKETRRYPIDFEILDTKEVKIEIELPSQFKVKYLPEGISEDFPWFKFNVEYKYKNNKIYFHQVIESKKSIISENEYPDFKVFFERLAKKAKQRVILEKIR
ncbi:MAG: DUF3857 domain-containing protein [Candidatus Omnitrophota bacterium]|nr:DUF3857 domain-containing protein [Candidatus Omnitrophota bacterium]